MKIVVFSDMSPCSLVHSTVSEEVLPPSVHHGIYTIRRHITEASFIQDQCDVRYCHAVSIPFLTPALWHSTEADKASITVQCIIRL
jgi:hypothetical protein